MRSWEFRQYFKGDPMQKRNLSARMYKSAFDQKSGIELTDRLKVVRRTSRGIRREERNALGNKISLVKIKKD